MVAGTHIHTHTHTHTLLSAATLWASWASISGSVSALCRVCCSFCLASSRRSWSCRFFSSLCKQTGWERAGVKLGAKTAAGQQTWLKPPGEKKMHWWHALCANVKRGQAANQQQKHGHTRGWNRLFPPVCRETLCWPNRSPVYLLCRGETSPPSGHSGTCKPEQTGRQTEQWEEHILEEGNWSSWTGRKNTQTCVLMWWFSLPCLPFDRVPERIKGAKMNVKIVMQK